MRSRYSHLTSWTAGLIGLVVVVWVFKPADSSGAIEALGLSGILCWLALTLAARLLLVETTVRPLRVLGFSLRRVDAFWIAWMRSFSNQVLPLSGVALYAHQLRRKFGLSWSELASLSTPQFFLAALAVGMIGLAATLSNVAVIGPATIPLTFAYLAVGVGAIAAATRSDRLIEALPKAMLTRASNAAASFRKLARHRKLAIELLGFQFAAILTRGSRIWLLFAATGTQLGWQGALLIVALAESAVLVQLTPAGLGLREGAVIGAAALLGIPPEISASVALIDRVFTFATTTALAGPAFVMTYRIGKPTDSQ